MRKIKTILLIDDDSINNFINARLLKKCKISDDVQVVSNGREAIMYLNQCIANFQPSPELILLDINMPVMDGFEFLTEFNKIDFINKSEVVIIMLTTSSNPKDIERLNDSNIAGFLNKPLTEEMVKGLMEKNFSGS